MADTVTNAPKGWNPQLYLRFEAERTRPAADLAHRIPQGSPKTALDVGCGPGNSSRVLADAFPGMQVLGIDSSPEMLETARRDNPGLEFMQYDVSTGMEGLGSPGGLDGPGRQFDVIYSNACLQWVPNHAALIPSLLACLNPGGVLAVQVPLAHLQPVHSIICKAAGAAKWAAYFPQNEEVRHFHVLAPGEYYDLLAGGAESNTVQLWQTDYHHVLPNHGAIVEWYRSTGLRPYLAALPEERHEEFLADILAGVAAAYPTQANGAVLFPFPRLFFITQKHGIGAFPLT